MKTIFSKLMFYLTVFFLLLCGLTYLILSFSFENYYLKSRTDNLSMNVKEVLEEYNRSGESEDLTRLIEQKKEEGTVIQLLPKEAGESSESGTYLVASAAENMNAGFLAKGEGFGGSGAGGGNGQGSGGMQEAGSGAGGGSGQGIDAVQEMETGYSGSGQGAGSGAGSGSGQGKGYGAGSGSGQGTGTGQGSGSGQGEGYGTGSGSGQGTGAGQGSGSGQGAGSGAGSGSGQGNGAGNGSGQRQQEKLESQIQQHESGETFVVVTGSTDHEVEWMTYKETANDGTQVVGRIPLYSIHEVIDVVQHFLILFLLIIFMVSLVFAYFFARGISKPLVNLKNISQEMGKLNFSQKYSGKRKDEIGELGNMLNHISDQLEETILKLHVELNKERTMEKMRKRFTAQISHEIQTPLAVVKSYAEALEDGLIEDEDEQLNYYQTIVKETDKVSTIASDLLDLAQIESGAYRLKKEKEDPGVLLMDITDRFKNTYPQKNIQLINTLEDTCFISMDRKRMEQVFYNLLNNAIKHVEPENGEIKVSTQILENTWYTQVYNAGSHIPENELDQIWAYFYKAQSEKKGTGLGLAIVKGIVLGHGGSVSVKNEQDGVVFGIMIPVG